MANALEHLIETVNRLEIKISRSAEIKDVAGFIRVQIDTTFGSFTTIIDDEYDDVSKNDYAALQAVLLTILDLIEEPHCEVGRTLDKYPEDKKQLLAFWFHYQQEVEIADLTVCEFEWQLNSGDAFKLRNLKGN